MTPEIETLKKELSNLQKKLEALEANKKQEWDFSRDYFCLNRYGGVEKITRFIPGFAPPIPGDAQYISDLERLKAVGNLFCSREDAELVGRNRKIHVRLKELADFEPDWSDKEQYKFYLGHSFDKNTIDFKSVITWGCPNVVYFTEDENNNIYSVIGVRNIIKNIEKTIDAEFGEGALFGYLKRGVI